MLFNNGLSSETFNSIKLEISINSSICLSSAILDTVIKYLDLGYIKIKYLNNNTIYFTWISVRVALMILDINNVIN